MGFLQKLFSKEALKSIRVAFRRVEGELNEHLDAINANTNEIQSVYEVLADMETKMDKLTDRIDRLQIRVDGKQTKKVVHLDIAPLTKKEKEVFFALYAHEGTALTYKELAKKLALPEVMVQEYVTSLIAKGIPITKKYRLNNIYLSLDQEFKEMQAKEKIIEVIE